MRTRIVAMHSYSRQHPFSATLLLSPNAPGPAGIQKARPYSRPVHRTLSVAACPVLRFPVSA
jgi:hypothetical protein